MAISDLDIFRSAKLLVKQHGASAPIHAAMRADAMLEKGNLDGRAVARRAKRASRIETVIVKYAQLLSPEPGPERLHATSNSARRHS